MYMDNDTPRWQIIRDQAIGRRNPPDHSARLRPCNPLSCEQDGKEGLGINPRAALLPVLEWVAMALAVAGVVFNNFKLAWCFPLWLVSNTLSAFIHATDRRWGLWTRDLIFIALALWGWWLWRTP